MGPAQLVPGELGKASFRADVIDNDWWNGNSQTQPSYGNPHSIIVSQLTGERLKTSNSAQRLGAQGNGRAETGLGEPKP